jgi:phosphomannomutase
MTRKEIQALVDSGDQKELSARMVPRISFGTAGLRAKMQAGYSSMNELVVQQTSQGLCMYLEKLLGAKVAAEKGLVLGFDGRHNSRAFAFITAAVFLSRGHKVYLMHSKLVCTPFVPFGVRMLKAAAGVMVTASHNPKEDNGYKVYWSNGCQIISPHDGGISQSILNNLQPWPASKTLQVESHPLLVNPLEDVQSNYYATITKALSWALPSSARAPPVKITYTAMHGVGHIWASEAFKHFGLPPYVETKQQLHPDPDFPTVKFPNPEEGKGALKLAMATADANGSAVILANDPDADRLAVAERLTSGEWRVFNGNEIGILLASWVWTSFVKNNPKADRSRCAMISTAVSSKMIKAMAQKEGFQYHETLTGFKWIGNKAVELSEKGVNVLFGYEEAIGFMVGHCDCLDKDGVRAAAVMGQFVYELYGKGETLSSHLQALYKKYGFFCIQTKYFFCYQTPVMESIFARLRTGGKDKGYLTQCGAFKIKHVRDQTTGFDSSETDSRTRLPITEDSQMITYTFENGCVATLRGSGTEPKLKYYVEMSGADEDAVMKTHQAITEELVMQFLRVKENGLVAPVS